MTTINPITTQGQSNQLIVNNEPKSVITKPNDQELSIVEGIKSGINIADTSATIKYGTPHKHKSLNLLRLFFNRLKPRTWGKRVKIWKP